MGGLSSMIGSILEKIGLGSSKDKVVGKPETIEDIQAWLITRIAAKLNKDPSTIEMSVPFAQLGVDSLGAINITSEIEEWLETEIDPTILYQYINVTQLSGYLAHKLKIPNGMNQTKD
jgi:acyl carrier protein